VAASKVAYELRGDVAVVTLTEPETLNSMSLAMMDGLAGAIRRAAGEARAMVLTGAGDAFCAGDALQGALERLGQRVG
jgi:2-(1,2-epoxy-1,2-dihydrophenyl)acetyl-CoA isomerase